MTPETEMNVAAKLPVRRGLRGKARKLLYGALLAAVLAIVAYGMWVGIAGSNQWRLVKDKNGVQVWTLKTPGSSLVQVKAHTRIKSSLAGMVKLLEDPSSCVDAHCYDGTVIERLPAVPNRYAAYVSFKFDIEGLRTREYVLFQQHYQDPNTGKLVIHMLAAPDRMPRDPCCVRITHLDNTWRLTPLPDGVLDVEFAQDTDLGGLPSLLADFALVEGTYQILDGMQGLMNLPRYRHAQLDSSLQTAASRTTTSTTN